MENKKSQDKENTNVTNVNEKSSSELVEKTEEEYRDYIAYAVLDDIFSDVVDTSCDLSSFEKDELVKLCENQQSEIEKFRKHYSMALVQLDIARRQCADYKLMYDIVSGSAVWKMTKPLRVLLDIIKWPFKAHLLRKGIKFFAHVRKHGLKSAFQKIKQRRNEKEHSKNITHVITPKERTEQLKVKFSRDVKFSILVPLYNTPLNFLEEMIDSVCKQTYFNWELCLADGSDDEHAEVGRTCIRLAKHDDRIKYKRLDENRGISINTNACIDMATGDYIALFDHDDILHPSALFEMMKAICDEGADYVYTDEVTFESPDITKLVSVHYKPDYAPDNLKANNYICHFSAFSREILEKSGRFRSEFDGSQDHDLILRLTSNAKKIVHIPKVLYFWRSHPASVAMDINSKTYAIEAGKGAVRAAIENEGRHAVVESTKVFPAMYRIGYQLCSNAKVSIIIAGVKNEKQLLKCITSVKERTSYENYELILVLENKENKLIEAARSLDNITLLVTDFNQIPKQLNMAAEQATGDMLLFMNGGGIVISNNWLDELLMYSERENVGAVAGTLYYPDNTVRHAGYVVGNGKNGIAARMFHKIHNTSVGYMGRLWYAQNLSAVSSEMMMIRKEVFLAEGGFDTELKSYYYDVDLCLKLRRRGMLVVWTPYAAAYAQFLPKNKLNEEISKERKDASVMNDRWEQVLSSPDPYYNVNFSRERADFSL